MDHPERRRQVLIADCDRVAQPRRTGHFRCLRGWPEGLLRSHRGGIPMHQLHQRVAVHRIHGQAQPELYAPETP